MKRSDEQESRKHFDFYRSAEPGISKTVVGRCTLRTCVAAHDFAATWVMYKVGASAFFLSLMSTVASLPFFLFTLPAGALADIVDRRKLLWMMNIWLAVAAALLAIFDSLRVLNPYIILICIFSTGNGFAFNAPAWTAIVPELVSDEELQSAATLGGLQLNISGILGPAMGGMLLPLIGANWVFTLNAICFLVVVLALLQWKRKERPSKLPLESFFESFSTAIRYVRYAPGIQVVLARNIFCLFYRADTCADPSRWSQRAKTHGSGLWHSV
jgi:MFS family permease